ncbi:MAG: dienelactone hydrolase family protein [Ilumatobacteraceae bacterium]|nr:dienelactone hydrolase family protein [Ilumatobacteraceae bacterium]
MTHALNQLDPLDDFDKRALTFGADEDATKSVYVAGSGPAVIVITEMPCITPYVARFARWVRDAGFTVWMPSLFGPDGEVPTMEVATESFGLPCVRREFTSFAEGRPSPMVGWLRQLSAHAHAECGGPGVGAIGMCFTGNFALGMMLEPSMLAPVMSQPSLPFDDSASTGILDAEMVTIRRRLDDEDLTVLAYRFAGDSYCKAERFESFDRALGDRLLARTLPDSAALPGGWTGVPHSVVTTQLIDEVGEPTIAARDEILQFFARRLQPHT